MHKILKHQLKKLGLNSSKPPSQDHLWEEFLHSITHFYESADHDRYLLEQALNISSEEMQERWERINKLLHDNEKHISILKSQNKVLSSISEDCSPEEVLQVFVHEVTIQLNLEKALMLQMDWEQSLCHMISSHSLEDTRFSEMSLNHHLAQEVNQRYHSENTPDFSVLRSKEDLQLFEKFFPETKGLQSLWQLSVQGNNIKYPSFLFLLPKDTTELTDHKKEVLNSLIQVVHILTHNFAAKKRLEEEQVKVIAASKKAALGEMAGGIAHEINNPLAIISGQTQKLKLLSKIGKIDSENLNESADKILKTIDRLSRIVYALRAFSRDDTKISKAASNMIEIMDDSLALCSEKIRNSGVELRTDYDAEEIMTFCNSVQISQVIVNLISNAYDAINKQENPWISIKVSHSKSELTILVTDSGDGIPAEIQEKIMQPFFTTKEIGHGTGIGLSLSSGIIKEHGGVLEYNNKSDNTQFIIRLPIHKEKEEELMVAS